MFRNGRYARGHVSEAPQGSTPALRLEIDRSLWQYRIILSADTASEVPQLPERCLSRKAGIVRCCPINKF